MTLELDSVIDHTALGLTDADLISLYRNMVLARKLDERIWALNRQGRVPFVVSVATKRPRLGRRQPSTLHETGRCRITEIPPTPLRSE